MDNNEKKIETNADGLQLEGRNAVWEALKAAKQFDKIVVDKEIDPETVRGIMAAAHRLNVRIEKAAKQKLDNLSITDIHQGIIGFLPAVKYLTLHELIDIGFKAKPDPIFILLDRIQDPHNVGAIIRTAVCMGVNGVVIPEHRAVGVTEAVVRASAGAVSHMPIARVKNMSNAIEALKKSNVWVTGADLTGTSINERDFSGPTAIVIGNEGDGLGKLVKSKCDDICSIPMTEDFNSLNASVAAGVMMYEIVRQRRAK